VFNAVVIKEASLHVERESDGTLNVDNFTSGWNAADYLKWAAQYADKVDWLGLLQHFVDYLCQPRPHPPKKDVLSRYSGGRSLPGFRPSFAVERLEIGRVHLTLEDVQDSGEGLPPVTLLEVELSDLALPARLNRDPITLRLTGRIGDDPDSAFLLSASFDNREEITDHRYDFELTKIALTRFLNLYETTLPVDIVSGRVTLSAGITVHGDDVLGEISLLMEGRRELDRYIDQLGLRIDTLDLTEEIPLQQGYAQLQEQTEKLATELIQGGTDEAPPSGPSDPVRELLEKLFHLEQKDQEDR
jgi:hypothetical protein